MEDMSVKPETIIPPTAGENVTNEVMTESEKIEGIEPIPTETKKESGETGHDPIKGNSKVLLARVDNRKGIAIRICPSMQGGWVSMTMSEIQAMYDEMKHLLND